MFSFASPYSMKRPNSSFDIFYDDLRLLPQDSDKDGDLIISVKYIDRFNHFHAGFIHLQ